MLNAASITNGSPFTATQRQELEHQALIFKYMVAGVPIPPELLYSIKRSLESSLNTSGLFPHHQPVGWGSIRVGFGRKADPEPGRCRRTDGKKWRCSKEAYPYSKYCERHMHRGRNRSRKPVELTSSSTTTTTNASSSCSSYTLSPHHHQDPSHNTYLTPFFHPHSSSSRSPDCAVTPQNSTTSSLFSESGSSLHADNDYRYIHGMRSVNERALFPEASGNVRSLQHPYQELTMGSYKGYSELGFHSFCGTTEHQQQPQEQRQQHCFVLGTDFKLSEADTRPFGLEKEAETQKPLHHFFDN